MNEYEQLENALRQFTPEPGRLDRDRLMFLAGQEAGRTVQEARPKTVRLGPASTWAMGSLAACLLAALVWQLSRPPMERVIVRELPPASLQPRVPQTDPILRPAPTDFQLPAQQIVSAPRLISLPESSVLQLRNLAIRFGVEALPPVQRTGSSVSPPSAIGQWQQLRKCAVEVDSSL